MAHKKKLKSKVYNSEDISNIEKDESPYFQLLLSNIQEDLSEDNEVGEVGEDKNRGTKRKRTEQSEC